MPTPPPPTPSQLAALHYSQHGGTLAASALLYGVTRQAVQQALARIESRTPRRKPGRRPSADPRRNRISVHVGARRRKEAVRVSDTELALYKATAEALGYDGVSPWLAALVAKHPKPLKVTWSAHLRAIANREVARFDVVRQISR